MSLFRKPKKNIQRRVFTEKDEDDDEEPMEVDYNIKDRESRKKDKPKSLPKAQSLLSFETEEEGEVFQVKKSNHSKKLMKMYERERKKKESKSEKEEVKELKLKERSTEIVTDDLILVVNDNHRPVTPAPPPILSGRDALCAGKNDLSSDEDEVPATEHRFSKPDNFKRVLESGAIPDAAMIHAARKRRQRARELGGDFVPLEEEEVEDKGRLLREDDNEGSDEERIDMGANPIIRDQERRREQFYEAQDSDHEVDEWEDQQIRKGVTGAALNQELLFSEYQITNVIHTVQSVPKMDPEVPRTPEAIIQKLREHYEDVCKSKNDNCKNLKEIQDEIANVTKEIDELKLKAPKAADRFRFYQELRGYITDLVECLDEKVGIINSLEQRAMDTMSKKAEWLIERRRQDVRDQAEETTNMGKGITLRKIEDEEKNRRAVEREGRRTRRRRCREAAGEPKHVEGMSTDDEISQQDILQLEKEREQIENEIQTIFEDVVDEYSSVANILIKFEQWRETDMPAYMDAYATLCLPRVMNPLIRLNLIFWDPLTDSVDLEKLEWYRTLALYGLHDDETENTLSNDPDVNLLPNIIEKVILPKLTELVDRCWDPLSSSQTLRLVGVISRYIRRFPTLGPDSKYLHNLFNAILHKLKSALENDVFIPIVPKLAESRCVFFQRQFASGLKLLRNITSWQGILNDNTLKDIALNSLLNRYLLSAIKVCTLTDAVAKTGLVSLILPRIWLQSDTPQLQMFSACVTNLAQKLDKDNPLHLESIETLAGIIKCLKN
ncbi:GC-rich sequence DNA-binding factor-like protein [Popillia japonica]|uniref:GC-rich sequence DNA-binding factor-like protein n=1 Tax=Popillia japonica TaxID=7064 RepID=A0AAW1KP89_POPJA